MVPSSLPHRLVWCLALQLIQPRLLHLFARWPAWPQLKHSWFSKKNLLRISMVSTDLQSLAQWSFLQSYKKVGLETCTFFSLALPFGVKKWDSLLCSLDSILFLLNHLWILLIRASISQLSHASSVCTRSGFTQGSLLIVDSTNPLSIVITAQCFIKLLYSCVIWSLDYR